MFILVSMKKEKFAINKLIQRFFSIKSFKSLTIFFVASSPFKIAISRVLSENDDKKLVSTLMMNVEFFPHA